MIHRVSDKIWKISWICDLKVPDFPGFVVESSWSRWKMMEKLRAAQFHLPIFHDASAHYIVGEYVHPMLVCSMPMNFNTIGYYWYTIHWLSNARGVYLVVSIPVEIMWILLASNWDYQGAFLLSRTSRKLIGRLIYIYIHIYIHLNIGSISNFSPAKPRIHMSFSW